MPPIVDVLFAFSKKFGRFPSVIAHFELTLHRFRIFERREYKTPEMITRTGGTHFLLKSNFTFSQRFH